MSDLGPPTADAALRAAARPFRLAAFALAGPLVAFESLVAGAETLRAALEPDLGTLTVSPFEVLPFEPGGGGAVGEGPPVAGGRRRAAGAPAVRPSAARSGATQTRSVTRTAGETPATPPDPAPAQSVGADSVRAGAAAAAGDAIAAGASLLGSLADAAMDVVVRPPGTARRQKERKSSAPPSPPAAGGIGSLLDNLATASVAESILPGTGGAAVASRAAVETGAALLGNLAETALAAFAGPKARATGRPAPAAPAPRRRAPGALRETATGGGSTVSDLVLPGLGATGVPPTRPPASASGTTLDQLAAAAIAALAPAGEVPTAQDERPALRPRSEGETAVARALDRVQAATTVANVAATASVPAAASKDGSPSHVQPPAATAPSDLAWLVNEALVEQARRHGVDLS